MNSFMIFPFLRSPYSTGASSANSLSMNKSRYRTGKTVNPGVLRLTRSYYNSSTGHYDTGLVLVPITSIHYIKKTSLNSPYCNKENHPETWVYGPNFDFGVLEDIETLEKMIK